MPHRRHVVAGKPDGVIHASQRLKVMSLAARGSSRFHDPETTKRLDAVAILAVNGDRKIELAGKLPELVVVLLVQPFTVRQKRISDRNGAELVHGASCLFEYLAYLCPRDD